MPRLTAGDVTVGLSSRLYLIADDDTVHSLANAAYMRMLRHEAHARVPQFASQRIRQASLAVEVVAGTPIRIAHSTFSVLDFDRHGC